MASQFNPLKPFGQWICTKCRRRNRSTKGICLWCGHNCNGVDEAQKASI